MKSDAQPGAFSPSPPLSNTGDTDVRSFVQGRQLSCQSVKPALKHAQLCDIENLAH